ncbi:hypothetical protein ACH4A7_28605 [Streptomyces cyaneofuscatus]|uniref:hypothetical protein n=1 Tax=Streptomyces TaxID=1883 RepID=UPI002E12638E|nr:hypothetical protein OG366_01575 [Streptomyces cyaneofuscatus]
MRLPRTTALAGATCLLLGTVGLAGAGTAAAETRAATCTASVVRTGVTGTLKKCTESDGRVRVVGTLRDSALSNGATVLTVRIGTYNQQWTICGTDKPIDTGYRSGGAVALGWGSVSADRC